MFRERSPSPGHPLRNIIKSVVTVTLTYGVARRPRHSRPCGERSDASRVGSAWWGDPPPRVFSDYPRTTARRANPVCGNYSFAARVHTVVCVRSVCVCVRIIVIYLVFKKKIFFFLYIFGFRPVIFALGTTISVPSLFRCNPFDPFPKNKK